MTRKLGRMAFLAVAISAVAGVSVGISADDKKLSIEDIMKQGHNKTKGLVKLINDEVKAGKWDAAKKDSTRLKGFGETLGTLKPEKGDEASWKKLTDKYKEQTAAVAAAADKEDAKATTDALGTIGKSCKECHDAHR